jgi:putative DNA primase/helicase
MAQVETQGVEKSRHVFDLNNPLPTARAFINELFLHQEGPRTIHHYGGQFLVWDGIRYREVEGDTIKAQLYKFLEPAMRYCGSNKDPVPFQPTDAKVRGILAPVKAEAHVPTNIVKIPAWFCRDRATRPDPRELLPCSNGLLHLPTLKLIPSTPAFFSTHALSFPYDPKATEPVAWLKFLDDLWPNDKESVSTLREFFGYLLVPDTRQQKIFLIIGPKRSGKGTIGRVLRELLGPDNFSAPTLASMSQNFGLQPLIGKHLAVISDARLSQRADGQVIVERLLSISGEDALTIDRKHLPAWTGELPTRFLILTNELFDAADASGAFASRFIILKLMESFYGREDHLLSKRLLGELPGILNWAIDGWQRLRKRGHFEQPKSAVETVREFENLGSPISAFVRECCTIASQQEINVDKLFEAWETYCHDHGYRSAGNKQTFGRDLHAAVPSVEIKQRRKKKGARVRRYVGIGLR